MYMYAKNNECESKRYATILTYNALIFGASVKQTSHTNLITIQYMCVVRNHTQPVLQSHTMI